MSGTVAAHARADGGSGTEARPDEKMGRELRRPLTSTQNKTQKRVMAKKRRQRDRA